MNAGRLGLTAEAEELLVEVLRPVGRVALEHLYIGRDRDVVGRALDELRRNALASVHLGAGGQRVVSITDAGRVG